MNRRGFLQGVLALGSAPALVRVDSLMRIVTRQRLFFENEVITLYKPIIVPAGQQLYMRNCRVFAAVPMENLIFAPHKGYIGSITDTFFSTEMAK